MSPDLEAEVAKHLRNLNQAGVGVAVSGGSDSLALLHVLSSVTQKQGIPLHCVTVDHGLRPEARQEAEHVAEQCAQLDVSHDVLTWDGWDGNGNVQAKAREARYGLIAEWAQARSLTTVALGHTRDDQAETVLMRLMRSAGVDGLSGMAPSRTALGVTWLRPFLTVGRDELRRYLTSEGVTWVEDPSNDNTEFDRVKTRQALADLARLGLEAENLAQVAHNMQSAQQALDYQTKAAFVALAAVRFGAVQADFAGFQALPPEIKRRFLVTVIKWLSGSAYTPRGRAVQMTLDDLEKGKATTLDGCMFRVTRGSLWISREFNSVSSEKTAVDVLWDGRWRCTSLSAPEQDIFVAALGPVGLAACGDWRALAVPREVLMVTPALWRGSELLHAPLVNPSPSWHATLAHGEDALHASIFAH